jgi:hypothetical protein
MHLMNPAEQLAALENVHRHLEPGGTLIFDAFVPRLDIVMNGLDRVKDFEAEVEPGLVLRRIVSSRSDLIAQVSHITFSFEFDDGQTLRTETWETELYLYFRWELEHLMRQSPFKRWEILGDFDGRPLGTGSGEFIVIAEH